jgi:hypothetical protein
VVSGGGGMMSDKWCEVKDSIRRLLPGITFSAGHRREYSHCFGRYRVLEERFVGKVREIRDTERPTKPIYCKDMNIAEELLLNLAVDIAIYFEQRIRRDNPEVE